MARVEERASASPRLAALSPPTAIRVAKGALGPDAPHCDLFISQQHALWVDGLFIKAMDLVNGSSIMVHSVAEHSEIAYLHVKLAQHDVIFAEGAPSETLLVHSGNVERFDNFAEPFHRACCAFR
jgi:hypothetical protein